MPVTFFLTIEDAVSEASPCGPNPEEDLEYENFVAAAEGNLPASFLTFSRSSFDSAATLATIAKYTENYRDIRLLVLAAKYFILSGDIHGFSDALVAISLLLNCRWDTVYPVGQESDYSLRSAQVASLDDLPTVVLPAQTATLAKDRRLGTLNYRMLLIATKATSPRGEETATDENSLREAFLRTDDLETLKNVRDSVKRASQALASMRAIFIDKSGFEQAPSFDRLAPLLSGMDEYLSGIVKEREPAAAITEIETSEAKTGETEIAGESTASTVALPAPRSVHDAAQGLKALEHYYNISEPSNPALLLIRQAQQLVGKSYIEAIQVLAPEAAEKSLIKIGGDSPFALTFAQLKALAATPAITQDASPAPELPPEVYAVTSRTDAIKLMALVEAYYRKSEPSSPIPLIIERARVFADRDFATLLKDILKPA
jgi:type VI secretion system protein ImpA